MLGLVEEYLEAGLYHRIVHKTDFFIGGSVCHVHLNIELLLVLMTLSVIYTLENYN